MPKPLHQFDRQELSTYLATHIDNFGQLDEIERFGGGQSNPTYRIVSGPHAYVLRAKPPGRLLSSAHQVDREFRVLGALADTPVPVPRVYHLSGEQNPLGTMFYVMEMLDGRIFWDPALPELVLRERADVHDQICTALARLHAIDPASIGLADFGAPGNYFSRQLRRWTKQYRESADGYAAGIEHLIRWLEAHEPEDDGQVSIVHGDFRIDNLVFSHDAETLIGILDWELCTLGHPIADLAYFCMCLRLPEKGVIKGLGKLDRTALGLPDERAFVERYCAQRRIDLPQDWAFALAFSFFRLIAIATGVIQRAQQGNATNPASMTEMRQAVGNLTALAIEVTQDR